MALTWSPLLRVRPEMEIDDRRFVSSGASGEASGAGAEDGPGHGQGASSGKKKKGKSAKMIPLELQRLFARLQLLDARTVSTEVCRSAQVEHPYHAPTF